MVKLRHHQLMQIFSKSQRASENLQWMFVSAETRFSPSVRVRVEPASRGVSDFLLVAFNIRLITVLWGYMYNKPLGPQVQRNESMLPQNVKMLRHWGGADNSWVDLRIISWLPSLVTQPIKEIAVSTEIQKENNTWHQNLGNDTSLFGRGWICLGVSSFPSVQDTMEIHFLTTLHLLMGFFWRPCGMQAAVG